MAKIRKGGRRKSTPPPDLGDLGSFEKWLGRHPKQLSVVIAARAALRLLPLVPAGIGEEILLQAFRTSGLARFAAIYPTHEIPSEILDDAIGKTKQENIGVEAARIAAIAVFVANPDAAARSVIQVSTRGLHDAAILEAIKRDAEALHSGAIAPEKLAVAQLWPASAPVVLAERWQLLSRDLSASRSRWSAWIDWYNNSVIREPHQPQSEASHAAFTDVEGDYPWSEKLPWNEGAEAVNTAIVQRLEILRPGPAPVEGAPSLIAINVRSDGRIGADAGALAAPTIPPSRAPEDHPRALAACRNLAERLNKIASSPQFNGRRDYGEALSAYLEWFPTASGSGNILLADSEARVLTKLFIADEGVLSDGFASRLSVFLENHIAARAFYPEVALHYQSIRTGHIATPLPHDAVDGFRETVRAHSPEVFDETVPRVMEETAKPVPEASPPAPADAPPPDASRPKPPKDPIADADPTTSRSTIFARTANRIWQVLRDGKDLPQAIDGWGKAYDQLKPYIGPIIDWLKTNMPGGPGGTPPASPTIGV